MIRRFFICLVLVFFVACNDGDILTVDLDFDKELELCTNDNESYLIYDLRDDPNESLSLIIPRSTENEALFTSATDEATPVELTINETTIRFLYRTYNRAVVSDELCEVIQPTGLSIIEDYEAGQGKVSIKSTIEDDDNDGVPTIFENRGEPDENGDFPDAQDWDDDGIPDYLDEDDDGDNVKTINEIDNSDGDNDPTTNPMNSDLGLANEDDIPDYLDDDDDGDGIPTRLEDSNGENGPRDANDRANNADGELEYHYLNNTETIAYMFEEYDAFDNTYTRTVNTSFILEDIDLEILRSTIIDLGTLTTIIPDYTPAD